MKEEWKEIENHTKYEVSNFGRVRNKKTKRILKPQKDYVNSGSNLRIVLPNDNNDKHRRLSVARLVYKAFISKDLTKDEVVIHKDKDSKNNKVSNLEKIDKHYYMSNVLKTYQKSFDRRVIYEPKTNTLFLTIHAASKYYNLDYQVLSRYIKNEKPYHGKLFIYCTEHELKNVNVVI